MPYDSGGSGMWFTWRCGEDGRRYRDWTYDRDGNVQVDDRWKTGDLISGGFIAMSLDDDDDDEPVTVQ